MNVPRSNLLAAYTCLLGVIACVGWLYAGQMDDAPGAGLIGLLALLSAVVVAFRILRAKT